MAAAETVLVTGGTGFIGGWCLAELLNRGYQVRTTVRRQSAGDELRARLATVANPEDRLTVYEADLLSDAGWREAAEGCDYVLHVASPLGIDNPKDPERLIAPAREGALRALTAAKAGGVKRVVMTSSVAAASPSPTAHDSLTAEDVWTDPQAPGVGAYPMSKTLAERAAWAFVADNPEGPSLAVVNPALVLGPVLTPAGLGSVQVVQRLLNGSMPGVPRLGFNIVDVRDVADLHIRAMLDPAAAGQRFIAAGDYLTMWDMATALRSELGPRGRKIPVRRLPDGLLRLLSLFDPALRAVTPGLGRRHAFSADKAKSTLGWRPRPAKETLLACAESLIAVGAV